MYYARRKGQDIPIGDGVIKQIERYCEKFAYSVLTTRWLEYHGVYEREICKLYRKYAFVVNERLYELGRLLKDDLRFNANANGEYYWTNNGGSKIKVGLDSYTFQGNTVVFMVDKILSDEYPYSGYGFCINVGVDQTTANSGINVYIRRA
jgi:hypothetical protein